MHPFIQKKKKGPILRVLKSWFLVCVRERERDREVLVGEVARAQEILGEVIISRTPTFSCSWILLGNCGILSVYNFGIVMLLFR